jgi:hypothetical protein
MYISKRRSKRRLSVWGLIFAVLLTVIMQTLMLPCSANIIDGVRNGAEDAGGAVSDIVQDAESKAEELITDAESKLDDASDGKVEDSDGIIGDETSANTNTETKLNDTSDGKVEDSDGIIGNETSAETAVPNNNMGKAGQVALIVLAVAAIIAVIIIVTIMTHRRKD